jgi:hypothetical protein
MFELKRCILLHLVGTCEPTYLCFSMGGPPVRRATAINLDLFPTGFQKFPIFGTALASDLPASPAEEAGYTPLQYG